VPYDPRALEARLRALLVAGEASRSEHMEILGARLGATLTAAPSLLGVDGAGLMLLDEHEVLRVVGVSDSASGVLELAQEGIQEGTGLDCVRTGRPVSVVDFAARRTYPRLWRCLLSTVGPGRPVPFRAVMSVPVIAGEDVVGTLDVMSSGVRHWSREQIEAAEAYAAVIAGLLRLGLAVPERSASPPYDEDDPDA
jgi:GAF domain-containing protein